MFYIPKWDTFPLQTEQRPSQGHRTYTSHRSTTAISSAAAQSIPGSISRQHKVLIQKTTGKGWGESRQRVLQKKFQPISKGTPNFRKTTLTFQQPLCVIRQFHMVLAAAQQNTLISSTLRARGLPEDVHRSVQRPMPFVPMGRQCPEGRSWGQKQWRRGCLAWVCLEMQAKGEELCWFNVGICSWRENSLLLLKITISSMA